MYSNPAQKTLARSKNVKEVEDLELDEEEADEDEGDDAEEVKENEQLIPENNK